MDFEPKQVDAIATAAEAMLKLDIGSGLYAALEMESALSARCADQKPFTDRYVVEAAEAYVSDLDDRSASGRPEWETLSKAVDVAKAPVLADDERKLVAQNMAAQAAMHGMGR